MIVIKISGGLGNQMFQYAAAKNLAELHNTELKLDLSWFDDIPKGATMRTFELGCFVGVESEGLSGGRSTPLSPSRISGTGSLKRGEIERLFDKFRPWGKKRFYKEPYFHFDPNFFKLRENVVLKGYFQSEKYFGDSPDLSYSGLTRGSIASVESIGHMKGSMDPRLREDDKDGRKDDKGGCGDDKGGRGDDEKERDFSAPVEMIIKEIVRKAFTFKKPQEGKNKELAKMIADTNSVSLHIRRGDYVSDTKTNQTHGTCNLDYYQRCIAEIEKEIKNPHFFVFSDDINWVKEKLKINHPAEFVSHNTGDKSYEDMRLMSQCKHNIIANSSFSWWGAWLNPNPEKIVFAPKRWFTSDEHNTKDLIPEGWRKI